MFLSKILFFFTLYFLCLSNSYANTCESCKSSTREICAESCEGKGNYYNRCFDTCTLKKCAPTCNPKTVNEAQEQSSQSSCKVCLIRIYHGVCKDNCKLTGAGLKECMSNCTKKACGNECALPDITSDPKSITPAQDSKSLCQTCTNMATSKCHQSKCLENEAGCMFECVDTACKKYCDGP